MRELAAGLLVCAALNAALVSRPVPLPKVPGERAVEAAGFLSLGMRRLAADIGLVRLLVYYGTPEKEERGHERHEHGGGFGGGHYPEIGPRAREILSIDPGFAYPVLYGAGALAFNLDRPDEALALLAFGLQTMPHNQQLRAYTAAVAFHKKGDAARVIEMLEPTLSEPDCPTMIKSMLAFLYRRGGQPGKAVAVYRDILATSRDAGYRATAEKNLRELGHKP